MWARIASPPGGSKHGRAACESIHMSRPEDAPADPVSGHVQLLIDGWRRGEAEAADRLFARLYPELQRLAARALAPHRRGPTLDTGALVQEACLRLLGGSVAPQNAIHLRAIAATAMRQIVVDHPVNTGEGASWTVRLAELSLPEATALFQAAQFKFRLALAVEIRG